MKKMTAVLGIALLIFVAAGFDCSFTTANLGDIKFSKTQDGAAVSSFNTGEDIYAIVEASGIPSGKHKLNWKVTYDNVTGKKKGDEIGSKTMDFEGSSKLWQSFSTPLPGDYKVEATLTDDSGKTIATKTGMVKVTGSAPASDTKMSDDKKTDAKPSDDKKKDKDDDDD